MHTKNCVMCVTFLSFCFSFLCSIYWPRLFAVLLRERTMLTQWMQVCKLIVIICVMSQTNYLFISGWLFLFSLVCTLDGKYWFIYYHHLLFYPSLSGVTQVSVGKLVSLHHRLFLHFCQRGFPVQYSPLTTASPLCKGQRSALTVGF